MILDALALRGPSRSMQQDKVPTTAPTLPKFPSISAAKIRSNYAAVCVCV